MLPRCRPGRVWQQKIPVVVEAADYARSGRNIGEEQAPSGGCTQGRWKDHGGVGVERTRRGGVTCKFPNTKRKQQNGGCCQNIGEPCAVAGKRADQGNGYGCCRWRDCGDGLRQGLHGREHCAPQTITIHLRMGLHHIAEVSPFPLFFTPSRSKCGYDIGSAQAVQGVIDPTRKDRRVKIWI
jgi:hypothetical protein